MYLYMKKAQESRNQAVGPSQVVSKFDVKFDKRSGTFLPGESVSGEIAFAVSSAPAGKAVKIQLVGSEKVNWYEQNESTSKRFLAMETLAKSNTSDPGKCKFKLKLPKNLPPTFLGKHGSIQYWIEPIFGEAIISAISKSTRFEGKMPVKERNELLKKYRKIIKVQPHFDLRAWPELATPLTMKKDTSGILRSKNLIELIVTVPKQGFVAGEPIGFKVHIINGSDNFVTSSSLALIQETKFVAGPVNRDEVKTWFEAQGPTLTTKCCQIWEGKFEIPSKLSPISVKASLITVEYRLRVTVTSSGFMETVETKLPLTIGTVPIGDPASEVDLADIRRIQASGSTETLCSEVSYCSHGYLDRAFMEDPPNYASVEGTAADSVSMASLPNYEDAGRMPEASGFSQN